MTTIAAIFPILGLRITAGPLELRGISDDDIAALADLAGRGIHPPEEMPFAIPWTDAPADALPLRTAQYHWQQPGRVRARAMGRSTLPSSWDGVVVGHAGIRAPATTS